MRTTVLPGVGVACSALGFGCANLMGRIGRRQSERALASAYDHGVTFFDTSRSYGWGRSEEVLGRFLRGKRDKVVVCTKFGTIPPPRSRFRELAKPVARGLLAAARALRLPGLSRAIKGTVSAHAGATVTAGRFDTVTGKSSLETSLKELGTDYVDVLLLHNPTAEQLTDEGVFVWLKSEVDRGRVRSFGVSTDARNAAAITAAFPGVMIVQFGSSVFHDGTVVCPPRPGLGVVTNSPFGSGSAVPALTALAGRHPERARGWSERVGWDITTPEGASRLLLAYALAVNPTGVVLCGMHDPTRIRANAAIAGPAPAIEVVRVANDVRAVAGRTI